LNVKIAIMKEKQNDVHLLIVTFHRLLAKEPEFFRLLERVKPTKQESSPYIEFDLDFKQLAEMVKAQHKN